MRRPLSSSGERILPFATVNHRRHKGRRFGIRSADLLRHMWVLGKTGMGKSTLLETLFVAQMDAGHGAGLIDPHGDLAERVIGRVPRHRRNDLLVIDPAAPGTKPSLNLVGNAIKATARGGRIRVSAEADDAQVHFAVEDTGAGIAPENLPHLFDRFWQARADRRGTGLGLVIVKGILEQHEGRVWVESQPGRGTTFHFTIPTVVAARRSLSNTVAPVGSET